MDQSHTPDRPDAVTPPDAIQSAAPPAGDAPPPAPPLSPTAWLFNNGLFLLILLGLLWLVYQGGIDFLLRGGMVVLGLGFIIFIHELGHFLAAKWCDVHVQTFSIGFGPALPGCSFTRGETTYKLAAIPLGGYVNMVGEGPEADEDESYPRSFKNKPVWQRMIIISAGVIMNFLFGALAFILVYLWLGEERPVANVYVVDAGSPSWEQGVRPGWKIVGLDDRKDPFFDDVRVEIALTQKDRSLDFRFEALPGMPPAPDTPLTITPLRDENNNLPVVGISPAPRLKLGTELWKKKRSIPVLYSSPAAAARALALDREDVPIASTRVDGEGNREVAPLPAGAAGWQELARRMSAAKEEKEFVVRVRTRKGEEKDVPAEPGFDFADSIIATTDPATPDEPYNVKKLALDPGHPADQDIADPFDFRRRMTALAGKPIVIRVKRDKKSSEGGEVDVLVPPAYHLTFGLRMKMGKVGAIREKSPALKAGLKLDDVILGAALRYGGKGPWEPLVGETSDPKVVGKPLDPMRLPDQLYQHVHADPERDPNKWQVKLTVSRRVGHNAQTKVELDPMDWDDSWEPGSEAPIGRASPLSIPQLGLAYRVDSTVAAVTPGSPAAKAGIQPGDEIRQIRFRRSGKTPQADGGWSDALVMQSVRGKEEVYDQWAHYFWRVQDWDSPTVEVDVYRANARVGAVEMTAEPDTTWAYPERGFLLMPDTRTQIAGSLREAVSMGLDKTFRMTRTIYMSLRSMVSRRINHKMVGGPITIASGVFEAANDPSEFILLLGVISINLAVVNFLPIPVLDGGHMVFLVWEWVRGKPPPESVRIVATYAGLLLILVLMVFVLYIDSERMGWLPWKWKF